MAEGDFSIKATISANTSQFIDGIKKGEQSLTSFSGMIDKILGPKGKIIMALVAAGAAAVKMGQEMNAAMSEIAKGTGATGESLYKLRENVHDVLVNGVGRSAQEVGKMIADLNTRFKATGKELVTLTDKFDQFASVTGVDTKNAINMTADVMAKWNIENEDTSKLLDQLTKASQESGASVESLMSGLKQGQAVFSQFGMSATDTIAYISTLKENGIEVEQALIGMKTALAKFSQEGKDAQTAFAEVSEKIKNAGSETEALNIAVNTFGTRNGPEMVKVLRNSSSSVEEFKNKLLEAGGALEETDKASRTSKDAFDDLGATLKGSFGGIFEGIDTLVKNVVDSLSSVLRKLKPIIKPIVNSIRDIFAFVGEMFFILVDNVSTFITENSAGFKMVADLAQNVYETLHTILGNILEAFKTVFGLISSILQRNWPLAWEYAKQAFMIVIKNILDVLSGFINTFSSQINTFTKSVLNPFIDGINFVAKKLGMPLVKKFEPIGKVNLTQLSGLQKKIDETNEKIQDMTGKTAEKIIGDLGKVKKTNTKILKDITKDTKENTKTELGFWDKLKDEIIKDAEDWSDVVGTAYETMKDLGTEMFESIGESLVDGGASFEDYAAIAVSAIAEVLKALAAQLAAMSAAAAARYDYGTAAMAAAAGAAAMVASGVISGVANSMKKTSEASSDAATNIVAVAAAAKGSITSLQEFIDRVGQIKKTLTQGNVSDYIQSQISLNETIKDGEKSLEAYGKVVSDYYNKWQQQLASVEYLKNLPLSRGMPFIEQAMEMANYYAQLLVAAQNEYDKYQKEYLESVESMKNALNDNLATLEKEIELNKEYFSTYNEFLKNSYTAWKFIKSEGLINIQNMVKSLYGDLSNIGKNVGETLVDSIIEGATKKDFYTQLKDYIRSTMMKIVVYTESFQNRLAQVGYSIQELFLGDYTYHTIDNIKNDLEYLWKSASENAQKVDRILFSVFGKDITNAVDDAEEALSSFEEAMKNFFESISDLGGDIASNIINGLENGLTQGEFLENMKKWIRNMLIQTVVYTQSMKSEIEAIGKVISDGLTTGFTDTSLHEIRRDLSYIFNEANKTMVGLDSVLDNVFSGYASGTQNAAAGLHLVGEAGPELVRFRGGEQVLNAGDTRDMLENVGGNTNNFNVTFNNMQDTSAYAMMSQLREYNREMAINGII